MIVIAPVNTALQRDEVQRHKDFILPKLENIIDFGFVGFYAWPLDAVTIPIDRLREFIEQHRFHLSEALKHAPKVEMFQNGASGGYFPRGIRQDTKSTIRTTLYKDGLVAFDAQADTFMRGNHSLHVGWLSYDLQRHLQLTKALLMDYGMSRIDMVDFAHIEDFAIAMDLEWSEG